MNDTARRAPRSELLPGDPHDAELARQHAPTGLDQPGARAAATTSSSSAAGTAGLVTAVGAAGLGAKVALVERHLLGGDCLNAGCVPSKALLRSARFYADVRHGGPFVGTVLPPSAADFTAAMERMRRLRANLSHHDAAERLRRLGIDVFLGDARFVDRRASRSPARSRAKSRAKSRATTQSPSARLAFKKAVIANQHARRPSPSRDAPSRATSRTRRSST